MITFLCLLLFKTSGQKQLKDVKIQTLGEISVSISDIIKSNQNPVLFFTWSNDWCVPCVSVLDEIVEYYYKDYQEEYNLKLIGINVETNKTSEAIKEFIIEKGWTFDVYMDPEKNLLTYFNKNSAPDAFIFQDKQLIYRKSGFVTDEEGKFDIELTAEAILLRIDAIGSRMMAYDKDWNMTSNGEIAYFRTVDKEGDFYFVQDRWITGELQMKGYYSDKFLTTRAKTCTWYYKSGSKDTERNYQNGQLTRTMFWYENGQVWSTRVYQNGKLYNVNGLYTPTGSSLYHGTLSNGSGSLITYREDGTKNYEANYSNGDLHGTWTYYNEDGTSVKSQFEYENGIFLGKKE